MKRLYAAYNNFEKFVIGLIMLLLIFMGLAQVICRFVLEIPLAWAEEMMTFCLVWVTYLGASSAAEERKHIMVSLIVDSFPGPLRKVFTILSQLIWVICDFLMVYLGYIVTKNYIARNAITLGGKYPYWIASIAIPVGMLLIIIRVAILIVKTFHGESDTRSQKEIVEEEIAT